MKLRVVVSAVVLAILCFFGYYFVSFYLDYRALKANDWKANTVFSEDYNEDAFNQVAEGATKQEVKKILGDPLRVKHFNESEYIELFVYVDVVREKMYRHVSHKYRCIYFNSEGVVVDKAKHDYRVDFTEFLFMD